MRADLLKKAYGNDEGPLTQEKTAQLEREMASFVSARKVINHWVAWADVGNLIAEALLLALALEALSYHLLGVVACITGCTSCVWDADPSIVISPVM